MISVKLADDLEADFRALCKREGKTIKGSFRLMIERELREATIRHAELTGVTRSGQQHTQASTRNGVSAALSDSEEG